MKVVARDLAPQPRESQEATIFITVLKNMFAPQARIEPSTVNIGKSFALISLVVVICHRYHCFPFITDTVVSITSVDKFYIF